MAIKSTRYNPITYSAEASRYNPIPDAPETPNVSDNIFTKKPYQTADTTITPVKPIITSAPVVSPSIKNEAVASTLPKTYQQGVMENGKFVTKTVTPSYSGTISAPKETVLDKAKNLGSEILDMFKPDQTANQGGLFARPNRLKDVSGKDIALKILNNKDVASLNHTVAERSNLTSIVSMVQAIGPKTYQEAYDANRAAQAGDPSKLNQFLYQLGDSAPQTAIGVALSFVPFAGVPLALSYWTALSADEQMQKKGKIESLNPIVIDVALDSVLGKSIESLFKTPAKSLAKTLAQNFTVEGGTEVSQDLLKYQDAWLRAKTPQERQAIVDEVKQYFKSGQILMTFGVGGTSGAVVGGAAHAINKNVSSGKVNPILNEQIAGEVPPPPEGPAGPPPPPIDPTTANKIAENIRYYQTNGGAGVGTETQSAPLRDLSTYAETPTAKIITIQAVNNAIQNKEINLNEDGTITVYRVGEPSKVNDLMSVTYDKNFADNFDRTGKAKITEMKINPEDIAYLIGGVEKEILIPRAIVENGSSDMADFVVGKQSDFDRLIGKERQLNYRIETQAINEPYVPLSERTKPIPTGSDAILKRLRLEENFGNIPRKQVDTISRFIDSIGENMVDDVALSIRKASGKQGMYEYGKSIVTLFRENIYKSGGKFDRSTIHELWHSLARYLPSEDIAGIKRQFLKEKAAYTELHPWFEDFLNDGKDLTVEQYKKMAEKYPVITREASEYFEPVYAEFSGKLTGYHQLFDDENYRFKSLDEWFAETLTDRTFERFSQMDKKTVSIFAHIKDIVRKMINGVKQAFGADTASKVINDFFNQKNIDMVREGNLRGDVESSFLRSEKKPSNKKQESIFKKEVIFPTEGSPIDIIPEPVQKVIETDVRTPIKEKVRLIDYLRTPWRVFERMGIRAQYNELLSGFEAYNKELPRNIDKITAWSKQVSKESNEKIFRFLDGEKVILTPEETKVAGEIKTWLSQWADRLGMKPDSRISEYITHIFPFGKGGEIPEEIAFLINKKIPGSVYNPFLLQRQAAEGYLKDTWKALDAYVKRATRKVYMDPALASLKEATDKMTDTSQLNYLNRYVGGINLRPTELDSVIDNHIKENFGYLFGARPTASISRFIRQTIARAKIGGSITSFAKNLTQGVNTFSDLGGWYTAKGYLDLVKFGGKELQENGVLIAPFVEDRTYSAVKKMAEKFDNALFLNMTASELVNRGAAYYGGKAKFLAGRVTQKEFREAFGKPMPKNYKPTLEDAITYGKFVSAKTQFLFGPLDIPVGLNSDIMRTAAQFQTFGIKQTDFVLHMVGAREYKKLLRYIISSMIIFSWIGGAFGMKWDDSWKTFKFGAPPAYTFLKDLWDAAIGAKDQYGNVPSGSARWRKAGTSLFTNVVPGGAQIKRSFEGFQAVNQGASRTAAGNFQYKINKTPMNYIRGTLFGKANLDEAQKYYNKPSNKKSNSSSSSRYNPI